MYMQEWVNRKNSFVFTKKGRHFSALEQDLINITHPLDSE